MKFKPFASASLLTFGFLAACSSAGTVTTGTVGNVTPHIEPIDHPPPACVHGSVWRASSASIDMQSFGFMNGSSGYQKSREALTAAQESALEGLCLTLPPTSTGADYVSFKIKITDRDGSVATYRAAEDNIRDSDEGASTADTIDYRTLTPFLDTIHCGSASETRTPPVDADAGDAGAPWSSAPTLNDDPGCFNGVFAPYGCADIWLKVTIGAPGDYQLATVDCFEQIRIRLLSPDGATELAATPEGATTCPILPYRFTAAGTYLVAIEKRNAAGCSTDGTAGDFVLRVLH